MLSRVGGGAFLLKTHLMSLLIVLAHKIVTKGLKTRCIYLHASIENFGVVHITR